MICEYCGKVFKKININTECSIKCRILNNINIKNECWEWKRSLSKVGYGKIKYNRKFYTTHRLSYIIFKGEIPNGLYVLHTCDNSKCCNPDHLWVGTQKDNIQDAKRKGRLPKQTGRKHSKETLEKLQGRKGPDKKGEKHHLCKMKEYEIIEVRNMIKSGIKQKIIAEKYGITQSAISRIKTGRNWPHLKEDD